MSALFGQISEFDGDSERAIVGWEEWCERLSQYFIANDIATDTENGKRRAKAIFLSSVGAKTYSLIRTLCHPDKPETKTLKALQKLVKDHLSPEPIVIAERFAFYNRKQNSGESAAEFLNVLRRLAETCEFAAFRDQALRDMFVIGLRDKDVQKKLLSEKDLALTKAFSVAQASERTKLHIDEMCGEVSKVSVNRPNKSYSHKPMAVSQSDQGRQRPCFTCGQLGHWKAQCPHRVEKHKYKKSKGVKRVTDSPEAIQSDSSEGEYLKAIRTTISTCKSKRVPEFMVDVKVNDKALQMELDTGASVSLISQSEFNKLDLSVTLSKSDMVLSTITGEPIRVYGKCQVTVCHNNNTYPDLTLFVVEASGPALLGRDWLSTVKIDWGIIKATGPDSLRKLTTQYSQLFKEELGCVTGVKAELVVREGATPKFCKPRPVPFALKADIEMEIQRLVEQKVLKRVDYSDWASPIVPVKKPSGGLRLCGDYSVGVNKHLKIPEHPMPNIEELMTKLNGGVMFTKLDLSQAYQQIELEKASQNLVAINTHIGLYTYTRVPYGISAAPALFQGVMDKVLQGLNCGCYLDDIVITGRTEAEHLTNLEAVLRRLAGYGFRLQKSKCAFLQPSIHYLGFQVDKNGVRMDESATDAIRRAPTPVNKSELQSFLGLASQYRKFIHNMSSMAAPLNDMLKKDVRWIWTQECEKAFMNIKESLIQENVLAHYDPEAELCLAVDASPTGLGAVLSQKVGNVERPVAFASRSLTPAERNYSQLDREALGIIYGIKRFHYYVYGRKFTLFSDNLPLCHILSPKKGLPGLAAARIQRWALELANYDFKVIHRAGSKNLVADGLSRLPLPEVVADPQVIKWAAEAAEVNNQVISNLPVSATQIAHETRTDVLLSKVLQYVRAGWPTAVEGELQSYFNKKLELSVEQDCLLWGCRVIVPPKHRRHLLDLLHEGHSGIVRMKSLARLHVWWPNLDQEIEHLVRACELCKATQTSAPKLSHNAWAWPDRAWTRVHIDFAQIRDEHYLIMVDAHSKWPEVIYMRKNTTAEKTIEALRTVFARMGVCEEIVSDNGPPFTSHEFKLFLKENGVKQILSAPYHPASNGEAERFVRTFKKGMKCANGKSRNHACQGFLLSYRSTPHCTTGKTPSEMVFGRRIRTRLDLVHPNLKDKIARRSHGCKTPRCFEIGDLVMARNYRNPQKPTWTEGVVVEVCSPVTYRVEVVLGDVSVVWKRHIDQMRSSEPGQSITPTLLPPPVRSTEMLPSLPYVVDEPIDEYQIDAGEAQAPTAAIADTNGGRAPGSPRPVFEATRVTPRRSTRDRRPPSYLQNYDCSR